MQNGKSFPNADIPKNSKEHKYMKMKTVPYLRSN